MVLIRVYKDWRRDMSMYAYKDLHRKEKKYAKDGAKESRDIRFYCPNLSCNAHMYICGLDGSTTAYFSANRKDYGHIKGCPFGAKNSFNPDQHDENNFDFENAMDALAAPNKPISKKEEPGSHAKGKTTAKPLRTIRQIYDMCKSIDVIDKYNNKEVGQMIIDDRSEFMYPRGVFGKRLIEGRVNKYFYDSIKMELSISAPISSGKYTFVLKFKSKELFSEIQKSIYNNRNHIIVVSGTWETTGKFNSFSSIIINKKQIGIIRDV
jgi:hypothetical protein